MTPEPHVQDLSDLKVRPSLRRALGFRDLLFFYIVTTFSLRWIATAAAAGPSALVIWIIAAVGLFVPLVFATLELSSRYPEEGGIYVWSKRAFGPFAAIHHRLVVLGHEPSVLPVAPVFRRRQSAVRRRTVVAGVVVKQRLFRDGRRDRSHVCGDRERASASISANG